MLEAAFKVGTSAGCLIATDWRIYLAFSTSEVIALGYGADPATLAVGHGRGHGHGHGCRR